MKRSLPAALLACGLTSWAAAQDVSPKDMFAQLDKNQDQVLTADEIPEGQARFFERVVRVGDADKNGKITVEEFTVALKDASPQPPAGGEQGGGGPGMRRPDPGEMFRRLDRNGDGKLTKDEVPEEARERANRLFERAGTDTLTKEQFIQLAGQGGPGPRDGERPRDGQPRDGQRPGEMGRPGDGMGRPPMGDGFGPPPGMGRGMAFIRILDENGNGRISKEEMINIARLFQELDHNGDNELDAAELAGFSGRPGMEGGGRPGMEGGGRPGMDGERRPGGEFGGRGPGERGPGDRGPMPGGGSFDPGQFFTRMDANGDGSLTKEEVPERMQENFDRMDQDGNGKISQDELRAAMEAMRNRMGDGGQRPGPREGGGSNNDRPQRPQ
ncbi:EF-hand domain-containing protein [Planctomicrobium piriforme]|uniref:EF hand n=1 Tax=Planctomicrobium piriforme TaxID=1576369 RepID=A0A1I3ENF6_9PLAN|nr:EF-hand domain-containing protein [Planctomicrobium piriforme]SFI00525.1 EF hand [Planctomicrobium piriforme]